MKPQNHDLKETKKKEDVLIAEIENTLLDEDIDIANNHIDSIKKEYAEYSSGVRLVMNTHNKQTSDIF